MIVDGRVRISRHYVGINASVAFLHAVLAWEAEVETAARCSVSMRPGPNGSSVAGSYKAREDRQRLAADLYFQAARRAKTLNTERVPERWWGTAWAGAQGGSARAFPS
jgi:hypothetical protein